MGRIRNPDLAKGIAICFPDWALFGDRKLRAPHFIMLPMQFRNEHRWDMPGDQFKFFCHLIAHAATQSVPGVIRGDAYSISRACRCKPQSVLQYVSRLIELQLIQDVSGVNLPRLEENRGEERRENGHSQLPDWIFEKAGMVKYPDGLENPFFTREIFGNGIWAKYPAADPAAFETVFEYLQKIIYSEPWLSFIQTCLRNYKTRKMKESASPVWHKPQNYFLNRPWWSDFLNDNGSIPQHFKGGGSSGPMAANSGAVLGNENIIHPISSEFSNSEQERLEIAARITAGLKGGSA